MEKTKFLRPGGPKRYPKRRCPEPGCAAGTVRLYTHTEVRGRRTFAPVVDMCPKCGVFLSLLDPDGQPVDPRLARIEARLRLAGGAAPAPGAASARHRGLALRPRASVLGRRRRADTRQGVAVVGGPFLTSKAPARESPALPPSTLRCEGCRPVAAVSRPPAADPEGVDTGARSAESAPGWMGAKPLQIPRPVLPLLCAGREEARSDPRKPDLDGGCRREDHARGGEGQVVQGDSSRSARRPVPALVQERVGRDGVHDPRLRADPRAHGA